MSSEQIAFQAEVQQLLQLMIHSLYSNEEIFLRELISNSSDALDKARYEEVAGAQLLPASFEAAVRITAYPESKRLVIEDSGIGMTREEMVRNLGTIAHSGTRAFLERMKQDEKKNSALIGQFGVGFYSAFMVASHVNVESLSGQPGQGAWVWESSGDGSFTVRPGEKTTRGTRIELTLKEGQEEYAAEFRIRDIVRSYSNYVTFPVLLENSKGEFERINESTPLWAKAKREVTPEQYADFYRQLTGDHKEPLLHEHIHAEGIIPYSALVYIPKEPLSNLYQRAEHGFQLFIKRISVQDKCKDLCPEYLRFVQGVVETDELPLNVSRELLQSSTKLGVIRKGITRKILASLAGLAERDEPAYLNFYETFGPVLKEGLHFDPDNQETLGGLLRWRSSKEGPGGWVSLATYMERAVSGQKEIYVLSAPTYEAAAESPHLEALSAKGIEVLFLLDAVDEWVLMSYKKHGEWGFREIAKGDLDLRGVGTDTPEDTREPVAPGALAHLLDGLRTVLEDLVKDVKVSKRLSSSPCCLVAEEFGLSSQMERILKASKQDYTLSRKILEVNPSHPLIRNLAQLAEGGNKDQLKEWAHFLYEAALLSEGGSLANPGDFARRLTGLLETATGAQIIT